MGAGLVLAATLAAGAAGAAPPPLRLAITFDDLPSHSTLPPGETRVAVAERIVAALEAAGAPPTYGFVNAAPLAREPGTDAVLRLWRAAGNPVGNHGFTHTDLDKVSADEFIDGIARNEPALRDVAGATDWHWFRFPYLHEGTPPEKRLAVRRALAAGGYHIAAVTMSFGDYAFNEPFARCTAAGNTGAVGRLESGYLRAARLAVGAARRASRALYRRDIPYVLLMHLGAFDARMLPRLLALYRQVGFTLVTLPEAEADLAYRDDLDPALPPHAASLDAELARRELPVTPVGVDLAALDRLCR